MDMPRTNSRIAMILLPAPEAAVESSRKAAEVPAAALIPVHPMPGRDLAIAPAVAILDQAVEVEAVGIPVVEAFSN